MFSNQAASDRGYSPQEYPQAKLERAFIKEYLATKGCHLKDLHLLPKQSARALMVEACIYASVRLAEIDTRSTLVNELRGNH